MGRACFCVGGGERLGLMVLRVILFWFCITGVERRMRNGIDLINGVLLTDPQTFLVSNKKGMVYSYTRCYHRNKVK